QCSMDWFRDVPDLDHLCHAPNIIACAKHAIARLLRPNSWSSATRIRRPPSRLESPPPRLPSRMLWTTRTSQTVAVLMRLQPFENIAKLSRPRSPTAKVLKSPTDRVDPR